MANSSREWLDHEVARFAARIPSGAHVLDAGAGNQLYRGHFRHCTYESADFERVDKRYAESTYVCDLSNIPVDDARFDAILFTQVMEHLPDPPRVLAELRRVLKEGGTILYTGPLWYEEHEVPYDFFRYTQFGVRELAQRAGLEVTELRWLEGYLGTVAHQLKRMVRYMPVRPWVLGNASGWAFIALYWLLSPLLLLLSLLATLSDRRHRYTASGFPKNYLAVLTKPANGAP